MPLTPSQPSCVAGCNYIDLDWPDVSGATQYCVYRDGGFLTSVSGSSYRDGSPGSSQRCYRVTAKNECGESGQSSQTCCTAKSVPSTPSQPSCIAGCGYIDLDWSDVSGATEYCVYRDAGLLACVSGSSYRDNNPGGGQRCYRVTAKNDCGESSQSPEACCQAKQTPQPPPPESFDPITDTKGESSRWFYWSSVSWATSYRLQIDTAKDCNFDPEGALWWNQSYTQPKAYVTGIPGKVCWRVEAVGDCGGSGWGYPWPVYTDVREVTSDVLPTTFSLMQNYPNPFNAETKIEFSLPKSNFVKLDVFNIAGEKIAAVVSQSLNAGRYVATWDGRGDNGGIVASGVYFYRLKAGEFVETKKMILLK